MSKRTETAMLGVTTTLVAAFVVSFGMGVGVGADAPASTDRVVLRETPPAPLEGPLASVEVLNAAGEEGLARRATEQLREAGFDVVYFGNASASVPDTSVVIDRVGSMAVARRVADELGIDSVRSTPDSTLYLDATVVLGRDWRAVEGAEEEGGGWVAKVRRLFDRG